MDVWLLACFAFLLPQALQARPILFCFLGFGRRQRVLLFGLRQMAAREFYMAGRSGQNSYIPLTAGRDSAAHVASPDGPAQVRFVFCIFPFFFKC
jgi:hypothetical protein